MKSKLVAELSVDGGKARLITPKGEPSEWRDYQAVNFHCEGVNATFQENEKLVEWITHVTQKSKKFSETAIQGMIAAKP